MNFATPRINVMQVWLCIDLDMNILSLNFLWELFCETVLYKLQSKTSTYDIFCVIFHFCEKNKLRSSVL